MKQPLLHDIFVIVISSCMAIGLYRQEMRIDVQEKRIQMLEDALLLEKKSQSAKRLSRSLQDNCDCPFTKNENSDWVTTDADSLFIYQKGIIVGKKNTGEITPACNYGNNVLSVDTDGTNCPSGNGSVTFGGWNTASGLQSAVVGGLFNGASEYYSSISGGESNKVSSYAGSISGGFNNTVNYDGDHGSILDGQDHVLENITGVVPECPLTKNEDNDWVTTDADSLFIFQKGIIVGKKNTGEITPACNYGNNILSVDTDGTNCPSGNGSVTFGGWNTASGLQSAVVGGLFNGASEYYSSISGGESNTVSSYAGSISGGFNNTVNYDGDHGSILGGQGRVLENITGVVPECPFTKNEDSDWLTTDANSLFIFQKGIVIGKKNTGEYSPVCNYGNNILSVDAYGNNCPSGDGSITFGYRNTASGVSSAVVGGQFNEASGYRSSISGGVNNTVSGVRGSISGGESNAVTGYAGSISGGMKNTVDVDYGSILGGDGHVLEANSGIVSSRSSSSNATNATVIKTIPAHHPEDRITALEEHSPFDCTAEQGWCKSENKRFLFSEGIVVGAKKPACEYGTGTLSVDFKGTNCPSHAGSVTFGKNNKMSRNRGSFTVG